MPQVKKSRSTHVIGGSCWRRHWGRATGARGAAFGNPVYATFGHPVRCRLRPLAPWKRIPGAGPIRRGRRGVVRRAKIARTVRRTDTAPYGGSHLRITRLNTLAVLTGP